MIVAELSDGEVVRRAFADPAYAAAVRALHLSQQAVILARYRPGDGQVLREDWADVAAFLGPEITAADARALHASAIAQLRGAVE